MRESAAMDVWDLHKGGSPVSAIARELGVTDAEVRFHIRECWKRDNSPAAL